MSNDDQNEWDRLWRDYTGSLESWRRAFDEILRANSEMQARFNAVMEKASKESNMDTLRQFGENWQKAMSEAGVRSAGELGDYWQKAVGRPDNGFRQLAESWQKSMSEGGLEQMKAYGDMMKKFADTWNEMWPRK